MLKIDSIKKSRILYTVGLLLYFICFVLVSLLAFNSFSVSVFLILSVVQAAVFAGIMMIFFRQSIKYQNSRIIMRRLVNKLGARSIKIEGIEQLGQTLEDSLEKLDSHAERLNLIDRDVHFIRLFKGLDLDLSLVLKKLEEYDVFFPETGFLLVGFDVHKEEDPLNYEVRTEIISKSLKDNLPAELTGYVLDLEDINIAVFNLPFTSNKDEAERNKDIAENFANKVFRFMEEKYGVYLSAVISELHDGYNDLPKTYKEVYGTFEYKYITGNNSRIIRYTDYYVSHDSWYKFGATYHKFDEVRRLITSIQVGDFENAKTLITELITNDYSREYPSLLLARCRLYGVIDAAINAMGLIKEDIDEDFMRQLDPTTRVVTCGTFDELHDQLIMIFDAIIDYFSNKNKELPPSWFENTLSYIDKHYNDPDINVTAIANHFEINSAYYARVFKKYTGISPLDYIHKLRMKSAKKLMAKGISVKDAASIVGYCNPLTMSRAFKRYEGITPGNYLKNSGRPSGGY